ncbi:MAG: DUF1003 domain-containing protein [Bacteroidota bacterium]|nr:DUF1003 domain-containing protein [Bacteroidota bacterium]
MSTESNLKLCQISGKPIKSTEAMPLGFVKESVLDLIRSQHPEIDERGYISIKELKKFKVLFAESVLKLDNPILSKSEQEILNSLATNDVLSKSPEDLEYEGLNFGQKMADRIAHFVGSWKFIIVFVIVCVGWMCINIMALKAFDPYPFILLNLVLSCIAALQAPLIMMSQNRKEDKDRKRSENDYKIDLKAELEIQQLHEKMDILLIKMSEQGMK